MATWGIHHTSLSVSDADQSLRFYRDGLGLKLVGDSTERSQRLAEEVEVPGAWARCLWLETTDGHALLELMVYYEPKGKAFDLACNDIGAPHVSFLVDDIQATAEKLWSMGYKSTTDVQDVDPSCMENAKTMYFRDPDGIAVELFQIPEERKLSKNFHN